MEKGAYALFVDIFVSMQYYLYRKNSNNIHKIIGKIMQEILAWVQTLNPNLLLGVAALTGTFFIIQGFIGRILKGITNTFNRMFFYNIDIHYSTETYHKFNKWFILNNKNIKFMRNYKIESNDDDERILPGYGKSYFFIKNKPLIIVNRDKEEKKNIYTETDLINVKIFTISKRKMMRMFKEIEEIELSTQGKFVPHIYKANEGFWCKTAPLRDVLKPSAQGSKELIDDIQNFVSKKEIYDKRKIPFKRGYLLYGPPGTGKSSMVLYAANKFQRNVYVIDRPLDENLLSQIKSNAILLIEDIDLSIMSPIKRKLPDSVFEKQEDDTPPRLLITSNVNESEAELLDDEYNVNLSSETLRQTLNMLDGIYSYDDAIFICTTNDKTSLDEALLRPGRIDKTICINLLTPDEQLEFFNTFFETEYTNHEFSETESIAELSSVLIANIDDVENARKLLNIS